MLFRPSGCRAPNSDLDQVEDALNNSLLDEGNLDGWTIISTQPRLCRMTLDSPGRPWTLWVGCGRSGSAVDALSRLEFT